ncbi:hypothetical protein VTH8203_01519 [Vibrio thalassae]|uniref:Uncharacterized protein n=1 Tax=Vibrio thalassae TaxID=1243014 RepID=A0A240EGW3_9VIBR|nr:hypothetical protein [Vibrio thalassae]SNX47904.1 hypothetical protein VTH8203_01519 [Vibrio thalassae]
MPIIRLVALIGILLLLWYGIAVLFKNYGVLIGVATLVTVVLIGRIVSKRIVARLKSQKLKQ